MDTKHNAAIINDMIRRYVAGAADIKPQDWSEFVAAQNDGYRTGPEIGEKVPDFTLTDQYGKNRALADLMGGNGLLLVFVRSAHW